MKNGRRITFLMFMVLVIIYVVGTCSCTSIRMKKEVDYSYTQDSRDSLIARVHHYEIKHKEPQVSEKAQGRVLLVFFIIASLIACLI